MRWSARLRELQLQGHISVHPTLTRKGNSGCHQQVYLATQGQPSQPAKRRTYDEGVKEGLILANQMLNNFIAANGGWPNSPSLVKFQAKLTERIKA
jgi:hypothetical protein